MRSTEATVPEGDLAGGPQLLRRVPGSRRDLRYEIKMVVQESAWPWVRRSLHLDRAGVRTLHPPRRVQSVYFDTLGQAALEENLAGISHREKIRFRWYGEGGRAVRGQLERKVRHNQLGWKDVLAIPEPIDVEGALRGELTRAVFAHLDQPWADVRAAGLFPVQWIAYDREYLTTADGTVRITLDRRLVACDQRPRMRVSARFPTRTPRVLIVEAKCSDADHEEARSVLRRFPLMVDKCSKFVIASRPLEGPPISIVD